MKATRRQYNLPNLSQYLIEAGKYQSRADLENIDIELSIEYDWIVGVFVEISIDDTASGDIRVVAIDNVINEMGKELFSILAKPPSDTDMIEEHGFTLTFKAYYNRKPNHIQYGQQAHEYFDDGYYGNLVNWEIDKDDFYKPDPNAELSKQTVKHLDDLFSEYIDDYFSRG